MKSYELMPTTQNLLEIFQNDTINRNKDVFYFADILNSLEDSCSIAIDGNWGSGKTFFVHQVKMFLDANNPFVTSMNEDDKAIIIQAWNRLNRNKELEYQPHVSIYYDAWANDNDKDPVLSIVYTILKSIDTYFGIPKDADLFGIASNILEYFAGGNWGSLIDSFRSEDPLDELRKCKAIDDEIKRFFDAILEERGNRLVIFVDELDRCKPSFAVRLLERIKHYFANERITFVFSINSNELQHTIKRYYGDEFDSCRYLDRFFDLRMSIPPVDLKTFYFSLDFDSSSYVYDLMCHNVINKYNFSLREIAKYLRVAKYAAYKPTHDQNKATSFAFKQGKAKLFCMYYIVPIMLGLKIANTKTYNDFILGKDPSPLLDFKDVDLSIFKELLNDNESYGPSPYSVYEVSIEEKLKQVYEALFKTSFEGEKRYITIGKYTFDKDTADTLNRIIGLFSEYSSFDIE